MRNEEEISAISKSWGEALSKWVLPEELINKAPKNPYRLDPSTFKPDPIRRNSGTVVELERIISDRHTASRSLLDVGSASGGISLLVAAGFEEIIAVDQSREMLNAFTENATELGLIDRVRTIHSNWPTTEKISADIVLNANVLYNVANPGVFVKALIEAARNRVIIEVTKSHPLSNVNQLYEHFHGIKRPTTPTSDDVIALIHAFGYDPQVVSWSRESSNHKQDYEARMDQIQARACIEDERRKELMEYLESHKLETMEVVMIAFDK